MCVEGLTVSSFECSFRLENCNLLAWLLILGDCHRQPDGSGWLRMYWEVSRASKNRK